MHRLRRHVGLRAVHRVRRAVPHEARHAGVDVSELRDAARAESPQKAATTPNETTNAARSGDGLIIA